MDVADRDWGGQKYPDRDRLQGRVQWYTLVYSIRGAGKGVLEWQHLHDCED